jgi:hypothetical protein
MLGSMIRTALVVALAGFGALLLAHGGSKGKSVTITAAVVDTGCYMSHETKGADHLKCATACARAGVPLALVEEKTGVMYLPVAMDHKNQNDRLMPFLEKRVKVTGVVMTKGGMKGIVLKTIDEAK